jgi:hypothetical protein
LTSFTYLEFLEVPIQILLPKPKDKVDPKYFSLTTNQLSPIISYLPHGLVTWQLGMIAIPEYDDWWNLFDFVLCPVNPCWWIAEKNEHLPALETCFQLKGELKTAQTNAKEIEELKMILQDVEIECH